MTSHERRPSLTRTARPRRAVRPCDLCRIRKSRCVIPPGLSRCTLCQSRQTACTFDQKPPPRPPRLQSGRSRDLQQQLNKTTALPRQVYRNLAPSTGIRQDVSNQPRVSNAKTTVDQSPASSSTSSYQSPLVPGDLAEEHDVEAQSPLLLGNVSRRDEEDDGDSLGLSRSTFAELYGLTSDMEPILMVRAAPLQREPLSNNVSATSTV